MQDKIIAALPPVEVRGDEYHVDCPFCPKKAKPGQTHFSYNVVKFAYKCHVCSAGGNLYQLARFLNLPEDKRNHSRPRPPRRVYERKVLPTYSEKLVSMYAAHPARYEKWLAYRGLRAETVDRFRLGYGRLPGEAFMYSASGLILPVFISSACRTLRGRLHSGWMTAGGKMIYSPIGKMEPGATVMFVENCANACLIAQAMPWITPLALTTGAASWDPAWIEALVARRPALVIMAGDADDAGRKMNARWAEALVARGVLVETMELNEDVEQQWILK